MTLKEKVLKRGKDAYHFSVLTEQMEALIDVLEKELREIHTIIEIVEEKSDRRQIS